LAEHVHHNVRPLSSDAFGRILARGLSPFLDQEGVVKNKGPLGWVGSGLGAADFETAVVAALA